MNPVTAIKVSIWGHQVGALALDPETNYYAFEYYPEFRNSGIELSPLLLPAHTEYPTVAVNLPPETYHRLPAFIADSLPDDFGNNLINAWMLIQGQQISAVSPLDRLAYIGKRAMGALEFEPALRSEQQSTAFEVGELTHAAKQAVRAHFATASKEDRALASNEALQQLISVGTSAGGARPKAVVGFDESSETFVPGQFDLPANYEHWLIKFDTSGIDDVNNTGSAKKNEYGRIEYAYYLMALDCGIAMAESRIFEEDVRAHFMTRRFDRGPQGEKYHTQTLCAMAGLDYKQVNTHDYVQLFQTAKDIGLNEVAVDELFRRMVFNIVMSNYDDHSKNFSFRLRKNSSWELAPAYDLTHSYASQSHWVSRHQLGIGGKFDHITAKDLMAVGRRFGVLSPKDSIEKIVSTAAQWSNYAKAVDISASETKRVKVDIDRAVAHLSL